MPAIRSPPALKFKIRQPFLTQNVKMETLTDAQIVRPSKIFDANFAYPESLLRLVREAELDDAAVFWFTLVVLDADKEERQYVLQATAAQVQPRSNRTRDGGVGLSTWVYQKLYPPAEDTHTQAEQVPEAEEVPVVTDATFSNMVSAVWMDTCSQPNGPTRAQFAEAVGKLHELHNGLGKNVRTAGKRHRVMPVGSARDDGTPAARRLPTEERTPATPVREVAGALPPTGTPPLDSPVIRRGPPPDALYRVPNPAQGTRNAAKYELVGSAFVLRTDDA